VITPKKLFNIGVQLLLISGILIVMAVLALSFLFDNPMVRVAGVITTVLAFVTFPLGILLIIISPIWKYVSGDKVHHDAELEVEKIKETTFRGVEVGKKIRFLLLFVIVLGLSVWNGYRMMYIYEIPYSGLLSFMLFEEFLKFGGSLLLLVGGYFLGKRYSVTFTSTLLLIFLTIVTVLIGQVMGSVIVCYLHQFSIAEHSSYIQENIPIFSIQTMEETVNIAVWSFLGILAGNYKGLLRRERKIKVERKIEGGRKIRVGNYFVPLWIIVVLLISGVGASTYYIWQTLTIQFEVKEPLEIISFPSVLSLYPGETIEFNVTIMNHASINYSVVLDFSLDNSTYQGRYVTCSNDIYTVMPGQQELSAWLAVVSNAPPTNASLTVDFKKIGENATVFFDDFDDGVADGWTVQLGNFQVVKGEYYTENEIGEKSVSIVDGLVLTDCIIEVNLRFTDAETGFRSGIVFRYIDDEHYYVLYVSAETSAAEFCMFSPGDTHWGATIDGVVNRSVVVNYNTDYLLRVHIQGGTFTGFLNGEKILQVTDGNYTSGQVGLRAQRSDIFFDNFKVRVIE